MIYVIIHAYMHTCIHSGVEMGIERQRSARPLSGYLHVLHTTDRHAFPTLCPYMTFMHTGVHTDYTTARLIHNNSFVSCLNSITENKGSTANETEQHCCTRSSCRPTKTHLDKHRAFVCRRAPDLM